MFGVHWPINEGSYFKLKHLDKLNVWSAFNWSIDEGSSFKLEHTNKSNVWSALANQ